MQAKELMDPEAPHGHAIPMFNSRERFVACRGIVKSMPDHAKIALLAMIEAAGPGAGPDLDCVAEEILHEIGNDMRLKVRNEAMILCALEYALPRMSYAGGIVRDVIRNNWQYLSSECQSGIETRIAKAIDDGRAGDAMDVAAWKSILDIAAKRAAVAQ